MTTVAAGVRVRGGATPEEIAAVLTLVAGRRTVRPDGYARWRRTRLAALQADTGADPAARGSWSPR